ncbi:MAG: hypothetical protein ACD_80C00041G0007 [uncultured bacterium (gcode 4)]|uniref:CMP/dCMP-type deaminase domain-containing protein n=1 Tax=uncultured bacterium (gcode 4) TaxID=1234023 RepID=K1XYU4_9BACT|nr:MAG: hypothetical protein ACD_80C00041G0007 [uncultured bacterium (gcode 4)]
MRYLSGEEEQQALKYITEAAEIALQSTCERARCGCVIVWEDEVIGTWFNSPSGEQESQRRCSCDKNSYNKKVTDKTCCVHAEQRAIMNTLIDNPDKIIGARLYFIRIDDEGKPAKAGKPYCTICSKMTLDAGVKEFVLWHEEGICVYDTDEYNTLSFAYAG